VDFLPYVRHHITAKDIAEVTRVLAGGWLTQGPEGAAFERDLAVAVGAETAVACSSGTAALHLAMMAKGVKPGDRVITTPLTFCATANAIRFCGGEVCFADVDPVTLNINPKVVDEILTCYDPKPVGILAMHYGGRPCDMKALREVADRHHVWLVEDACHALGAKYEDGSPVGSKYADLSCWSFHATKHVAAGEGGAVTSPDGQHLIDLHNLRDHGRNYDGLMQQLGYNYRMSDINAALARSQLKRLEANVKRLQELAEAYDAHLPATSPDCRPEPDEYDRFAWHLYPIQVEKRDELQEFLLDKGIGTQVHYRPVYLHPCYQGLGPGYFSNEITFSCPVAEKAWGRLLSLPLFASMQDADVTRVCEAIGEFYKAGSGQ